MPTKTPHTIRLRLPILTAGIVGLLLSVPVLAYASTNSSTTAISQSYQTTSSNIGQGELVSLVASGSNEVEPATLGNAKSLVGIIANKPVLQLSTGDKSSIQVATNGSTTVLVSDANGNVNTGDKITVSPIAGIGMKAIGSAEIVGTAQKSLSSVKVATEQFKSTSGKPITVHVGQLLVAINVAYYSVGSSGGSFSGFVPPFLQNLANVVAGKTVSPLRVLIGTAALLLGFFTVALILYADVRNGVISLGRNPMAAGVIRRGMVDILVAALGVLAVTGVVVAAVIVV